MGQTVISEESANVSTPSSGFGSLFAKTDHHLYWKRSDGSLAQIDTGVGSILLQHGGAANSSQSTLNLQAGSNITISDLGSGTISIASTGGGAGGLTLGKALNISNLPIYF